MTVDVTVREMARHWLYRLGVLEPLRKLRSGDVRRGKGDSLQERFAHIYETGVWRADPSDPLSGAGSREDVAGLIGLQLRPLVERLGVRHFLDVGCGDFTWMKNVDLGCTYTGVDIVPSVIEQNKTSYGRPDRQFLLLNAVAQPLPSADMVLCREVLFHLSFADAHALIDNVRRSGATWLLATTDSITRFNADIQSGDFRCLNLRAAPFRFPQPEHEIRDDRLVEGRSIGVWRVENLPA